MTDILVVLGATATGKTAVADEICRAEDGEIISADSRQIYKYLDIGTNKTPTQSAQHLVGFLEPDERFSAGDFAAAAMRLAEEISSRGKIPVVCGGTGLYLKSLIGGGLACLPKGDEIFRRKFASMSAAELYEKVLRVDAPSAEKNRGNPQRLLRALEVYEMTGIPMSRHICESKTVRAEDAGRSARHKFFCAGLCLDREVLRARIAARAEDMVLRGIAEEAAVVLRMGFRRDAPAFTGIGYRDVFDFLDGKISRVDLARSLSSATAKYAKRQSTWFKTQTPPDEWFDAARPPEEIASDIIGKFKKWKR